MLSFPRKRESSDYIFWILDNAFGISGMTRPGLLLIGKRFTIDFDLFILLIL